MAKKLLKTAQSHLKKSLSFLKKRWKLLLVLLLIIGGGVYWRYQQAKSAEPVLSFQKPVRKDLTQTLEVSGVVDAKEKAQLRFIAGGKVVYLGAKEGDFVDKWQTIATIDPATLQKQIQQDLNNYLTERYQADNYIYDTKDDYWERSVVRQRDFNQLDMENEVLDVEIRDIAISNTRLSAPFAGVLTVSPTSVTGVQLLSSDYFEIINPETLLIRAEVDEADLAKVQLNQPAEIELDAYLGQTFRTQINYISFTSSQSTSGTVFLVELAIPNPDLTKYRIGMNGDVAIQTGVRYNALAIPLIATRERDGKIYVDVKTGENTTQEREIEIGLETDEEVEVLSGLTEQDEIVVPE